VEHNESTKEKLEKHADIFSKRQKFTPFYSLLPAKTRKCMVKASNKHQAKYVSNRRIKQPLFRLNNNARSALIKMIRHRWSSKYLKFNYVELKEHLEKQFYGGMSWDNYGKYWNIHHVVPVSLGNYDYCVYNGIWDLSNLRPIGKQEHIVKDLQKYNK
jgi:hypothetical protein